MPDMDFTSKTIRIETGDTVVLYTDGVTEAINGAEEMFGEERLRQIISENLMKSSAGIVSAILDAITAFAKDQPQADDITLMVIRGV